MKRDRAICLAIYRCQTALGRDLNAMKTDSFIRPAALNALSEPPRSRRELKRSDCSPLELPRWKPATFRSERQMITIPVRDLSDDRSHDRHFPAENASELHERGP
jgi:hypothetical protein